MHYYDEDGERHDGIEPTTLRHWLIVLGLVAVPFISAGLIELWLDLDWWGVFKYGVVFLAAVGFLSVWEWAYHQRKVDDE